MFFILHTQNSGNDKKTCTSEELGLHQRGTQKNLSLLPQHLGGCGAGSNKNNPARAAPVFDEGLLQRGPVGKVVQTGRQAGKNCQVI